MIFLISVLLTRTVFTSIHALQRFFSDTLHSVVHAHKTMPPCPHLNAIEEVNLEELKRKMTEVSLLLICLHIIPYHERIIYAWS